MNKSELIELVASKADISKSSAGDALDAVLTGITDALKSGDSVTFVGFGTFSVSDRAARDGRNPRTGETIKIKASKSIIVERGQNYGISWNRIHRTRCGRTIFNF